jgi:hypothetical protein
MGVTTGFGRSGGWIGGTLGEGRTSVGDSNDVLGGAAWKSGWNALATYLAGRSVADAGTNMADTTAQGARPAKAKRSSHPFHVTVAADPFSIKFSLSA